MSARPMRPPTATPPIAPPPIDFGPGVVVAVWAGIVEADAEEDEEVIDEVVVPLDVLVPLRKAWYALHPM